MANENHLPEVTIASLNKPFWVKVTSYDGTKYYAWTEQLDTATGFIDLPGGRSGSETINPVYDPNGALITINNYIRILRSYFDPTYDWVYITSYSEGSSSCINPDTISGLVELKGNVGGVTPETASWTVPNCVTTAVVECFGQGGAGDAGSVSTYSGSGGGGGAYSKSTLTVTPGDVYELSVDLTDSRLTLGTTVVVKALAGKTTDGTFAAAGGLASGGIGTTKYSGGAGIVSGAGGGGAGPGGDGQNATYFYGNPGGTLGAQELFQQGGVGYSVGGIGAYKGSGYTPILPTAGGFPGGGGGGSGQPTPGPTYFDWGGVGLVRITWGPGVTSIQGATGDAAFVGDSAVVVKPSSDGSTIEVSTPGIRQGYPGGELQLDSSTWIAFGQETL